LAGRSCPLQILLAEDNSTNQMVFSKMMQDFNVEITVAANGREALKHASSRVFDIVFMDMRMPEMDGLEATRKIRALGGLWKRIPIVALTANAFVDDAKACREAGMNEFISKPMRKNVLVGILAKILSDQPLSIQAA
jgi:CheY-like chemotaxis protein